MYSFLVGGNELGSKKLERTQPPPLPTGFRLDEGARLACLAAVTLM